jgi:hypothetical protein
MRKRFLAITLLAASIHALAGSAADCQGIDKAALRAEVRIPGHLSGRTVIGNGRLQFYSAPDAACKMPGEFVVPGDGLDAYGEYNGYTSVIYIHPKTGVDTLGWVESARLASTGRGMAPKQ